MKEINIKKQYPFQYYTIRNVDLLEQNGFNFDDYSFNTKHDHELYIGNINGLVCRCDDAGQPMRMMNYLIAGKKLTFLLPENYRECINGLQGFRREVLRVLDAESLKDQITIITYKVDNSDIIDKVTDLGKSMKFDCCIMNPPYDGSLHLKILSEVLKHVDRVVNISPVRWLQDPLAKYKKSSDYVKFEKTISSRIAHLEVCDCKASQMMFDISQFGDLGIYVLDRVGGYDYTLPSKDRLGKAYLIQERVLQHKDVIADHLQKGIHGLSVKVSDIRGFGGGKNFDIVSKIHSVPYSTSEEYRRAKFRKKDVNNDKDIDTELFLPVKSMTDGTNFVESTRTKFFYFLVRCWKLDQNIPLKFLPYMGDYSRPWTDKRFCEFFNITGYISDTEAEPGSEWETILNGMKQHTNTIAK